jgi:hypothetical protein
MVILNANIIGRTSGASASFDPDAVAFFTATGITDPTQKLAVNNLVVGMKAASLWTKSKVIYPFVGGTATTHKYNLKDPRDLDAAFRITFTGGVAHAATGVTFNGTTGFADTHFNPSTDYTSQVNAGLGLYQRTNTNAGYAMGNEDAAEANTTLLLPRLAGSFYAAIGSQSYSSHVVVATGAGFSFACRDTGTGDTLPMYKNGANVFTALDEHVMVNASLYIGAVNQIGTGASHFNADEQAFCIMSDSLTAPENATLYTLVLAYQTTLGRNV